MDYLKAPISFKLKKTLSYLRFYGFRRTLIKVQGQKHLRREHAEMPGNLCISECGKSPSDVQVHQVSDFICNSLTRPISVDREQLLDRFGVDRISRTYYCLAIGDRP